MNLGKREGPSNFNLAQVKPAKLPSFADLAHNIEESPQIFITEVIKPNDPRAAKFNEAKKQEILGLIEKGTFKIVLKHEAGDDPNIIPCRFVLAIKNVGTNEEILKARFVLDGHKDKEKRSIVHNATTLKQSSIRILLALAAIFKFDIWSTDIKQAYLQSASKLKRKIFIKPDEIELSQEELIQIIKPLYGLSDSGDYWDETLRIHHLENLKMKQSTGDLSLFFKRLGNKLVGISGSYVDDLLGTGTKSLNDSSTIETNQTFETKDQTKNEIKFTGLSINGKNKTKSISQSEYIRNIELLPKTTTFDLFRSMRAKLNWISNSRPDISCAVSMASAVTEKLFNESKVKNLNSVIKHLKKTENMKLKFPPLDQETLKIVVYSDASFANNDDLSSQIGYIVFLSDNNENCSFLTYSPYKSERVCRSTMAAETMAFADAFDSAFILRHDLERAIGRKIPLLMLTDSQALFDVLTRAKYTSEKRLMIDIEVARNAYAKKEIDNIALIESQYNPAYAMTKISPNEALIKIMKSNKLDHPVKQYIIETS